MRGFIPGSELDFLRKYYEKLLLPCYIYSYSVVVRR